jgi:hypothetical protein
MTNTANLRPTTSRTTPDHLFIRRPALIGHAGALLDSFARLLGRELVPRSGDAEEDARRLYTAPFAVLSHGCEADPILNFGNAVALRLWERDFDAFTQTPSHLTAEAMLRDERDRALRIVATQGYIDDYAGVRISSTGRRFRIARAVVWNVTDAQGLALGQAATFSDWQFLEP